MYVCMYVCKIGQRIPEGDYRDKLSKMDIEAKAFQGFKSLKNTRKMSSVDRSCNWGCSKSRLKEMGWSYAKP